MAWTFRRSIRIGPIRVNLSRSGAGYSVGVPGYRVGVRPNGRRYRSIGIPGTGLSNRQDIRKGAPGCMLVIIVLVLVVVLAIRSFT
jgi:Protein of unknown function (DUF4236)